MGQGDTYLIGNSFKKFRGDFVNVKARFSLKELESVNDSVRTSGVEC